ncbi:hypothetical protein [Longimicrobium sp.]|uniref:hypothetical protein n=1 Tax=Longimicrobium sp. TaxID=2029185 RepID=UPI0039C9D1E3
MGHQQSVVGQERHQVPPLALAFLPRGHPVALGADGQELLDLLHVPVRLPQRLQRRAQLGGHLRPLAGDAGELAG